MGLQETEGYRICARCVMDTSDPEITFDSAGVCNHCLAYDRIAADMPMAMPDVEERRQALISEIKNEGRDKQYDCILGLSGGLDSSYLALLAHRYELRPLVVHMDNGWDSELASNNIQNLVRKLDFDLYTHVVDWAEFRDIQRALLMASVIDLEMPTDHGIVALCYRQAIKHKVRFILSGTNFATESTLPRAWAYRKTDLRNLRAIHAKFGTLRIRTLPTAGTIRLHAYRAFRRIVWVEFLNFVRYDRTRVIQELMSEVGWKPYEGKHGESTITRFYQGYILPRKFGIDKRRAHLSSLIMAGQLTRDDALENLQKPPFGPATVEEQKEYVAKKLGFTTSELDSMINKPPVSHLEYPSDLDYIAPITAVMRWARKVLPSRP